MKGDQIGTLTAHPSLQELSLSNWTWFRNKTANHHPVFLGYCPLGLGSWSLKNCEELMTSDQTRVAAALFGFVFLGVALALMGTAHAASATEALDALVAAYPQMLARHDGE